MSYYRYTNNDGSGIFYGKVSRELDKATLWLPVPPVYQDPSVKLESWFTEEGNMMFVELVLPILKVEPMVEVKEGLTGIPVYMDRYQVVIRAV